MKEHIYTIPIREAMAENSPCPNCKIYEKEERNLIEYTLGPSMMEPDSREESNKTGFCSYHLDKLLNFGSGKLSMALMLSTHFDEVLKDLGTLAKKTPHPVTGVLKKKSPGIDISSLEKRFSRCVMCKKMEKVSVNCVDTLIYMWKDQSDFRKEAEASRGFCNKHLVSLINHAPHKLNEEECRIFISKLLKIQAENANKDKENLLGFIDQFDYQKRQENSGDYSSALSDVVTRLQGKEI